MKRRAEILQKIKRIIEAEQHEPGPRALALCNTIRERHGNAIKAFLLYGSGLRDKNDPDKLLDVYVLIDRYTSVHGWGAKAVGSYLAPPSVHYVETVDPDGIPVRSKYSIVSLRAFHKRASGGAFESMLWARFAQPAIVISDDAVIRENILTTMSHAVLHFAAESIPLIPHGASSRDLWVRGLVESYRSELRAEDPNARAAELVDHYHDRYEALAAAIYNETDADVFSLPATSPGARNACRLRWAARRMIGKPLTAIRVLKAAFTFDGGLDYILYKLKSHSGVTIEVTNTQRRHPIWFSPLLAWKLYRKGAFR
nr:MAG: hypothetical protein E4H34_00310 [Hyphomicrobiales bacterium]